MRKRRLILVLLAVAEVLLLAQLEVARELTAGYQRRFWEREAAAILGPGWQVDSVTEVDAPAGWERSFGGTGVMVSLVAPSITLQPTPRRLAQKRRPRISRGGPKADLPREPARRPAAVVGRVASYHPRTTLYLMPLGWQGVCHREGKTYVLRFGYREAGQPTSRIASAQPAGYDGCTWRYHVFGGGERIEKALGVTAPRRPNPLSEGAS